MTKLGFGQKTGQIIQMAYVVEDIRASIDWLIRNAKTGPWFLLDHFLGKDHVYRGARSNADVSIAMAFAGLIQIAQAIGQVRNRGTILLLGLCTRPDTFNSFAMLFKEVRLVTSAFFTRGEHEEALDAGVAEPRMLVTDTISLDDTPARFEALRKRTHECKVLIAP